MASTGHRRRWMRISLRTFLLCGAVLLIILGLKVERVHQQRAAVDWVLRSGGRVQYEYQIDPATGFFVQLPLRYRIRPYGPRWWNELLGYDFFNEAASVSLYRTSITDQDLQLLQEMPNLRTIGLEQTAISDAGLRHLLQFENLQHLFLNDTKVTDGGVEWLRRNLPHTNVHYRAPRVDSHPSEPKLEMLGPVRIQRESTRLGVQVSPACVVRLVHPSSPAALASIQPGDAITSIDGETISEDVEIVDLVDGKSLGATLQLTLHRSGKEVPVQVTLDGAGH